MSRQKIIAGNWKMNKSLEEAIALVNEVLNNACSNNSTVIFFPPFPLIPAIVNAVATKNDFYVGAQNCSEFASGAYTGEVSASMLASVGCRYVLVGHSERRQYFNENAEILTQKIKQALSSGINPVFCIGEKLEERKSNKHFDVVKKQLEEVLSNLKENEMQHCVLAYEPVWAIGTGETATPAQAQEIHAFIRSCVMEMFNPTTAKSLPILYGGSCNAQNAGELFACADIDGGLIGGASLKSDEFCKIIASV